MEEINVPVNLLNARINNRYAYTPHASAIPPVILYMGTCQPFCTGYASYDNRKALLESENIETEVTPLFLVGNDYNMISIVNMRLLMFWVEVYLKIT